MPFSRGVEGPDGQLRPHRRARSLRIPTLPGHHVRRPRLLELLDDAVTAPLTAVVAPAGSGKTVLLAAWATETDLPVAWLELDDRAVDGAWFWTSVIDAVNVRVPSVATEASELTGSLDHIVVRLLDELDAALTAPMVLVIDDVHVIDDADAVIDSLGLFLRQLPDHLHVVLASRHRLRLPLDRLRARGQLGEVGFEELRFSATESAAMLGSLVPSLTAPEVAEITERADGWAAGMQLAALGHRAARARADTAPPAPVQDHLVGDYVLREVLIGEDPALTALLFDISVAERVNADLARAVSENAEAGRLLGEAEARGLFVTRIGSTDWCEIHPPVRRVLVQEQAQRDARRQLDCRARAAHWLRAAGELEAALEQWRLAGAHREVLRLIATHHVQLYDRGGAAIVRDAVAAIPADVASADLGAMLDMAWCLLLVDRTLFLDAVDQATWWAARDGQLEPVDAARLTMLRSIATLVNGDWVRSGALARSAVDDLASEWHLDPIGRTVWNMVGREIALTERWDDDADEVREVSLALRREPNRVIALEATRALGEALAGRPVDALRVAAGIRAATSARAMTLSWSELAIAEAIAHREMGEAERARLAFEELADLSVEPMSYVRLLARLQLVLSFVDGGDTAGAGVAFERARALVRDEAPGDGAQRWLARVGVVLAVASADIDAAQQWSAEDDEPFWGGIGRARIHLALGERAEARDAIEGAVARCPLHRVVLALTRARAAHDHAEAIDSATAAVELALRAGMLQTVASEGPVALELVEQTSSSAPPAWLDRLRRAASVGHQPGGNGPHLLIEPLTARERDVLRFLPSRLTISEIADELYVSVNTLKFHLKVIYRKLGVRSRGEAAAIARTWTSVRVDR
jgi:LuxR family maltose regulon positive regulatory protein